jgi:HD-GYP domain-containing protein (c-di-GMP phosphodiesterase class II)
MEKNKISLDALIEIVANGGSVKTGIDIYNKNDVLLMEKDVPVHDVNILLDVKKSGVLEVPIIQDENGGVWDRSGSKIELKSLKKEGSEIAPKAKIKLDLEARIKQINEEKKEASSHYKKAQTAIKTILSDIKQSGGKFDISIVENSVSNLINYVSQNKNAAAHLINEILSHDSYLHNHSVNVCILGTAVLNRFNDLFEETKVDSLPDRHQISIAFFLHDTGKVFIDESVLEKKGLLTPEEFAEAKKHSYEKGLEILRANNINNTFAQNIVAYHHGPLYQGEENCYPNDKNCAEIPPYVKICKLADIFDARTSKRCYKEAYNPAVVMADMFKSYVNKDKSLQLILHSFVSVVGICPPSSIVSLSNGQLAYVLDSNGPLIMPFTDIKGLAMTTSTEPIDLGEKEVSEKLTIKKRVPSVLPIEVYNELPHYLKASIK